MLPYTGQQGVGQYINQGVCHMVTALAALEYLSAYIGTMLSRIDTSHNSSLTLCAIPHTLRPHKVLVL